MNGLGVGNIPVGRIAMQATDSPAKYCGAKTRNGGTCHNRAMLNGRCRMHGGNHPKGVAHYNFKDGSRSRYMPENLAGKYKEAQADPDLGSLIRNIALNEAFIREKLEALNEGGDSGEAWEIVAKALKDLATHFNNEDYGKVLITIELMKEVVSDRQRYHMAITAIQETLAEQRKDLKVKADIELKEQNAVSINNLMVLMGALVALINREVPEHDRRAAISEGIRRIIGSSASRQLLS